MMKKKTIIAQTDHEKKSIPQKHVFLFSEIADANDVDFEPEIKLLSQAYMQHQRPGVQVQPGFIIPRVVLSHVLELSGIGKKIKELLRQKDVCDATKRKHILAQVRHKIERMALPKHIVREIQEAYKSIGGRRAHPVLVAVRPSAVIPAAKLPGQLSAAKNFQTLLRSVSQQWAALYTDSAWEHREQQGIDQLSADGGLIIQITTDTKRLHSGVATTSAQSVGGEYMGTVSVFGPAAGKLSAAHEEQYELFTPAVRAGKIAVCSHTTVSGPHDVAMVSAKDAAFLMRAALDIADIAKQAVKISWTRIDAKGPFCVTGIHVLQHTPLKHEIFTLKPTKVQPLVTGRAIGHHIVTGKVFCAKKYASTIPAGMVLVVESTTRQWEPVLRSARALIIEDGDESGHAALFARDAGIPCLIGVTKARSILSKEKNITLVLHEGGTGQVFRGSLPFEVTDASVQSKKTKTKLLTTISNAALASRLAELPNDGVLYSGVEKDMAVAFARTAIAFFPRPALLRLPQGTKNEFQIIEHLRTTVGLTNIIPVLPRCRTPEEAHALLKIATEVGVRSSGPMYGWCDLPANAVLAQDFIDVFDGVVIDAEQLTRLTFGLSASDGSISLASYQQRAVQMLLKTVITASRKAHKPVVMSGLVKQETIAMLDEAVRLKSDMLVTAPDLIRTVRQKIIGLEKTIGRTGSRTNSRLLGLLVAFGVLAAGLLNLGAGCSDATVVQTSEMLSPAELRTQIIAALEREAHNRAAEGTMVTVSDFASFSITVPAGWSVEHQTHSLLLTNSTTADYLKISRVDSGQKNVTSTEYRVLNNQTVKRSVLATKDDKEPTPQIFVYDVLLADKSLLEIQTTTSSESIIQTLIINPDRTP